MELDQLQLLFNVATITGVTSLATFCYLLRRANKELTSELNHQRMFGRTFPDHAGGALGSRLDTTKEQNPNAPPTVHRDIREFVAARSQDWGVASTRAEER